MSTLVGADNVSSGELQATMIPGHDKGKDAQTTLVGVGNVSSGDTQATASQGRDTGTDGHAHSIM